MKRILTIEEIGQIFPIVSIDNKGENARCVCPMCGKNEFYVSLSRPKNPFRCWRRNHCGFSSNTYLFLKHRGKLSLFFQEESYQNTLDIISLFSEKDDDNLSITENAVIPYPMTYRQLFYHPYLETRGYIEDDYLKYPVGISMMSPAFRNRIIFSVLDREGKLIAYLGRSIDPQIKPKYKNSQSHFASILYGLRDYNFQKIAVIVEGIFDKKKVDAALQTYDLQQTIYCFSSLGSSLSLDHVDILLTLGVEHVILMYDKDVIQHTKANQSYKFLFKTFKCTFVHSSDPDTALIDEIIEAIDRAQDISLFALNTVKLFRFT